MQLSKQSKASYREPDLSTNPLLRAGFSPSQREVEQDELIDSLASIQVMYSPSPFFSLGKVIEGPKVCEMMGSSAEQVPVHIHI